MLAGENDLMRRPVVIIDCHWTWPLDSVPVGGLLPQFFRITTICFLLAVPVLGEQGHDELNEQQLGSVHFPTSCAPAVQKKFERGVALLHSFAFETAEAVFRQVAAKDPNCAMAHWGVAKTFSRWGTPNEKQLQQGWDEIKIAKSLHARTARERDYIDAVAAFYRHPEEKNEKRDHRYLKGMEKVYRRYPNDHEGAAFYAFALTNSDRDDDPTHARRKEAAAILEKLFAIEPNHPGVAHYLIHTYDYPGFAELGLPAARRYAKIAPAAPHALHMPSHIFAQLGLWQEDIESNLASVAASRNAAVTHMGDEGHQYHAMEFLMYAYLQSGQESEAQKLIEEVRDLPKMKSMYGDDGDPQILALVSYSASYALELHEWEKAADLALTPGTAFGDDTITYLARTIGSAHLGHAAEARRNATEIQSLYEQAVSKKLPWIDWADQERKEADAWADHAEGKDDQALALQREVAAKEKTGVFGANGELPAHEMLADMLLNMNRPAEALAEYETELKISPARFDSLYGAGSAAEMLQMTDKARAYYEQLVEMCARGNSARPELAHAREVLAVAAKGN
jgi:tetratricopeptide (TPR) repeat protein